MSRVTRMQVNKQLKRGMAGGFGRGDKGKQEVISNPTTFPGFNRLL